MQSTNPFNPWFRCCIVAALMLLRVSPAISQEINFSKVPLPDDIVGSITGITQDLAGNIWLSPGGSGLYQFDGFHFKSYLNDPFDPGSLASNRIECLYGDRNGNIWAGTFGFGLEKFDPKTNTFTHYKHDEKEPNSISGDTITCITQDREGFLWVGTNWNGVSRMDPATGKFTHYRHRANDPNSLSFDQVRVVYEDKKGVVWIGTGSNVTDGENANRKGGLNRFNASAGTFTRYTHNENNSQSLIDDRVRAIFEDSHGNFWVGTAGDGLHTLDRSSGQFERHTYDPAHPEKLSRPSLRKLFNWADDNITFITEDSRGMIWIGTFENGFSVYDPSTKRIAHYSEQRNNGIYTYDPTTWWAFTSRDGVLWMSTWNAGLYRFDASHQNILRNELPAKARVWSFIQEPDPIHYFGSAAGLFRINTKDNSTKLFAADDKKQGSISGKIVFTLYKDRKNRIWAGTENGLNLFSPDKQTFTSYKHDATNGNSLANDQVLCLYEDQASNFWVGTINGLDKMNPQTGEFTHYKTHPGDTVPGGTNLVTCVLEDSRHNLWVGNHSTGGLHVLDRTNGQFKDYLLNHSIVSVREDRHGKIWVGTANGLYSYNTAQDNFTIFIDPTSGNTITVLAMVEGNDGNLWIASSGGIYRINDNQNEVSKFGKGFGISAESLVVIATYKANDGKLIFGTTNGYYSLYPDSVSGNTKPPEIILTDFRITNQQAKPGAASLVKEDILQAKQIQLSHDQNVFAFSFNVIHYSNPEANKAMYKLENYDQNWHPGGSERSAYYYNIPPGRYIFRVKGASSENIWAEKSIEVVIAAPWWRNGWAYAIYGLVFVSGAWATDRFQKRRIVLAERKKNQLMELAQAKEIEKAYHELKLTQSQLIQSEKMASLGELTAGIAHEIQNPLNFVNNFSEVNSELIAEMKVEIDKGNLNEAKAIADSITENEQKIIFHGKRADTIVKGMLQHSRSSSGIKEPTDLNALADEYLRLAYHGLRAKDKSFNASMKTDFDLTLVKVNVTPQDIGRVILNLITNAFYAVSEKKSAGTVDDNYEPTVTVSTRKSDGKVEIKVRDNGNGVPQKAMDKIFQPFFTTKPTGKGTGLGLSLSYDIVRAHGGELKVQSKEGEFAEFVVLLPLG